MCSGCGDTDSLSKVYKKILAKPYIRVFARFFAHFLMGISMSYLMTFIRECWNEYHITCGNSCDIRGALRCGKAVQARYGADRALLERFWMAYGSGQRGRMLNFVEFKCYINGQLEHLYSQTPADAPGGKTNVNFCQGWKLVLTDNLNCCTV